MTEKLNPLVTKRKDIERMLTYTHVAAHLMSRGVLSMQEHREIMKLAEYDRVAELLDCISDRERAYLHLIDAMTDPDLRDVYETLVNKLNNTVSK